MMVPRDIADAMQACFDRGTTSAQKAACAKGDDIKERLAKNLGKKADQIDEAKVFEFIKDGAKDRSILCKCALRRLRTQRQREIAFSTMTSRLLSVASKGVRVRCRSHRVCQ